MVLIFYKDLVFCKTSVLDDVFVTPKFNVTILFWFLVCIPMVFYIYGDLVKLIEGFGT